MSDEYVAELAARDLTGWHHSRAQRSLSRLDLGIGLNLTGWAASYGPAL